MSRPGVPVLVWAAMLGVAAAVLAVWAGHWWEPLGLAAAAVGAALLGAVLAVRRAAPPETRLVSDSSASSALCAIGTALILLGPAAGVWLSMIGAGLLLMGAAGIVRETRAMRRARSGPDPGRMGGERDA
jgi:hypothetical protein